MIRAGISASPADAAQEVLDRAAWKLTTRGGEGAFREAVERLLKERGEWQPLIEDFEGGHQDTKSI
jgi:3-deoxy-D-manno-octulosonate 8-phosphate phosphatase KdsC-like HAD superfamily phosphatase